MNEKSHRTPQNQPILTLHRVQLLRWFIDNGGKELSSKEKPLDTPELIEKRYAWVSKYYDILTDNNIPVAFIDEKWFYTTNRRRKIKKIPLRQHETVGDDFLLLPKMRSRRFPVKSMFMGVIARPREDRNFDGKILLERVSEEKTLTRNSTNQNFSVDLNVNTHLNMENGGCLFIRAMR